MKKNNLGKTNISVSEICFGSLTVGPLQANLPVEQGAEVIAYAFEKGINFIDTAQLYRTYDYIRRGMEISGKYDTVISSKTYAYDKKSAVEAVEQARHELNRDYIDIFMLHEQESELTLKGHKEALDYLCECREKGIIRAVGVSMHHVSAVRAVLKFPGVEVIHPIINRKGLGIADGSLEEMLCAVQAAYDAGIGVFSMKPLGGGNLISEYEKSLNFVKNLNCIHSTAVGMQSIEEVDANIAFFECGKIGTEIKNKLKNKTRTLLIEDWCTGCGNCLSACGQGALRLMEEKAVVDKTKCVLCGYCSAKCGDFCIKII